MKYFLFLSFIFFFLLPRLSFAQQNTITVSPQLAQIDLSRDKPEAEFTYTNNTSQTVELTLSMQDVKELEDRGIPGLIDPNEVKTYKYGLSSWATFSNKNLVIGSGESKKVTIFIDEKRLTLGGHYASVLAEIKQIDNKGKKVKLRAILSSLLFVRTGTNEREEANIVEFSPLRDWFEMPKSMTFKLQNTGNVDVTPYGLIKIYDPLGREVGKGIVNEGSLISLPDSMRKYTVPLKNNAVLIPGFYKAHLSIHFGKKNIKEDKEITFFATGNINIFGIIAATVVCLGIFLGYKKFKKKPKRQ